MNIQEVREKYPQYGDLSDEQLGKALHQKFYSDMPYEDFASKSGIIQETQPQGNNFLRQTGIAARAAGPIAAGTAAGAALGAPLAGVGAIPGAAAGATAAAILQLVDKLGGTDYLEKAMDQLGLPRPETPSERVFSDIAGTMAGAAGVSKGAEVLSRGVSPTAQRLLQALGERQGLQITTAGSSALGSGLARESGAGPLGQAAAGLASGMAVPLAGAAMGGLADKVGDIGATIGSSFGNQRGTERLAKDAITRVAGENRERILQALQQSKELAGAKPTVGQAVAEAQIGKPERFGGALVRLEKDLTGAKGIEDILPSAYQKQKIDTAAFEKGLNKATAPLREKAFAGVKGGVDPDDEPGRPG